MQSPSKRHVDAATPCHCTTSAFSNQFKSCTRAPHPRGVYPPKGVLTPGVKILKISTTAKNDRNQSAAGVNDGRCLLSNAA